LTSKNKATDDFFKEKGYTLIEVLVTKVILGILAVIAVPSVKGLVDKTRKEICLANRMQVRSYYLTYIQLEEIQDSPVVFEEYLSRYDDELGPELGVITYVDGDVLCSVHSESDEKDEGGDVPFL
jgi:prepilin-type N-terminal cleavage/methylation domain-containing protein